MNINDIMNMTPEEFADNWNNNNEEVVTTCYDALGVAFVPAEEANTPTEETEQS